VADYSNHERSIAEVLREMKAETSAFIQTRVELLLAELRQKSEVWKHSLPMVGVAVIFTMGTFATLTFTLVALIAGLVRGAAEPNSALANLSWAIGAACIFVLYGCIAAALGMTGYKRLTSQSVMPERTIRVLKQDQQWIQNEAQGLKNEVRAA